MPLTRFHGGRCRRCHIGLVTGPRQRTVMVGEHHLPGIQPKPFDRIIGQRQLVGVVGIELGDLLAKQGAEGGRVRVVHRSRSTSNGVLGVP